MLKKKKWTLTLIFAIICLLFSVTIVMLLDGNKEQSVGAMMHTDGLVVRFENAENIKYAKLKGSSDKNKLLTVDSEVTFTAFDEEQKNKLSELFNDTMWGHREESKYEYNLILIVDEFIFAVDTDKKSIQVTLEKDSTGVTTYDYELSEEQNGFFEGLMGKSEGVND